MGEIDGLDGITVTIRDDSPSRLKLPNSPDHVWSPLRFVPGTGPGVGTRPGATGADPAGRATTSVGIPVGEEHVYALEWTYPPGDRIAQTDWYVQVGSALRLTIEGQKDGWGPWRAVGELPAGYEVDTTSEIS
jgi:hypothetical protein